MLPAALLLLPIAPQGARVIYPGAAEIAAARLPVSQVIITRAEADALSDPALTERLIGHVPHAPIIRVERQRVDPAPMGSGTNALSWVTFVEQGKPLRGRLCESRSIAVTFDTVDGKAEPRALATAAEARPRRVFAVTQTRLIGVVAGEATARSCERATFAGGGKAKFDDMVAVIERLVAMPEGGATGLALGSCFNVHGAASARCDPRATLRRLDWSQLSGITRSSFTGEPVRWRVTVGRDRRPWEVRVEENRVSLRRDDPAPF